MTRNKDMSPETRKHMKRINALNLEAATSIAAITTSRRKVVQERVKPTGKNPPQQSSTRVTKEDCLLDEHTPSLPPFTNQEEEKKEGMLAWGLPANPETHRDQDENQHKDAPQCPTTYSEPNPPLYVSQPVCPFAPLRLSLRPNTQTSSSSNQRSGSTEPHIDRLRMRLAISGRTVCFPGPARVENNWSIPSAVFQVHHVVGQRVKLVDDDGVTLTSDSQLVAAILTPQGEVAPSSYWLQDVANDGWVTIVLGDRIIPFEGLSHTERPREDGSDVIMEEID